MHRFSAESDFALPNQGSSSHLVQAHPSEDPQPLRLALADQALERPSRDFLVTTFHPKLLVRIHLFAVIRQTERPGDREYLGSESGSSSHLVQVDMQAGG